MATQQACYYFDQWAENLTINLAENVARCHLGQNKVEKVRINLRHLQYWPESFKVILDNSLVAQCNAHKPVLEDNSSLIDYIYPSSCKVPRTASEPDLVSAGFYSKGKKLEPNFYLDGWILNEANSIASILRRLALRNCSRLLAKQLQHQGVEISDQFNVQFHDEDNYLIFSYEGLKQELKLQMDLYALNPSVRKLASQIYFKHTENRKWFMGIAE